MTKNINGDLYSDLITSADNRAMACGSIPRQKIDRIVIHHNATTNKNVALNTWLATAPAQTSAHYEIADDETIGVVGEGTTAWHAGDANMNARSIGIEHKNETGAPTWTISEKTYLSSAKLIADICKRYGFKPDATHVIPHSQVHATQCPGGINMDKLRTMALNIYNGGNSSKPVKPSNPSKPSNKIVVGSRVQPRWSKNESGRIWRFDDIKQVNGIWQGAEYLEAGGRDNFSYKDNGIPLSLVTLTNAEGARLMNQTAKTSNPYFKYNTYFKVTKQGHNVVTGDMSFIVPENGSPSLGFWVLTKYLY